MALIIEVKVVPSSGRSAWIIDKNGMIKCFLKEPPEKGEANKELIASLARILSCSRDDIEILSGKTSRKKKVKINSSLSYQELLTIFEKSNHKKS
jgi:hypothetical protein